MTLEEAFDIYKDTDLLIRKEMLGYIKERCAAHKYNIEEINTIIKASCASIDWLKEAEYWSKQERREEGYFIPKIMIENFKANDWILLEDALNENT
jgi:hypothetical protein